MTGQHLPSLDDPQQFPEGSTRDAIIRARVNQGFFRAAVLAAYEGRCCITAIALPQLLSASHIVPWAIDVKNRTNPRNGLCLNALHDRAFDSGLLTITPDFKIRLSPKLKTKNVDIGIRDLLVRYEDTAISLPKRFAPDKEFLRYHNESIFVES